MTEETATPRTDAVIAHMPGCGVWEGTQAGPCDCKYEYQLVDAEFARQLESEERWLLSHCRAIGMTKKSDSGEWHHDVALFTITLKDEVVALTTQLAEFDPDPVVCGCHEAGCPHTPVAKLPRQALVDHFKARIKSLTNENAALTTQRDEAGRDVEKLRDMFNREETLGLDLARQLKAAEAQRDELQKRIGYTAVPSDKTCESPPSRESIIEECALAVEEVDITYVVDFCDESYKGSAKWNGAALMQKLCAQLVRELKTGTAQATECETNGTEGLRAELDAAKRALTEKRADGRRMDWLEQRSVYVAQPLRWGSKELFQCSPDLEEETSDLRACIDAALAAKPPLG